MAIMQGDGDPLLESFCLLTRVNRLFDSSELLLLQILFLFGSTNNLRIFCIFAKWNDGYCQFHLGK